MGKLVEIKTTKSSKGRIVPLGTPVQTKMPETQIASPAMPKAPTMSQLQQQRQQAQVDMDMEAVNRLDAQMKQMRAQTGQQTLGDRIGSVLSGTTNTGWGQTVNAAGTLATGVDYNERQIKRLQETLANGYTSDGKLLTDAQRKSIEESIAKMQKENAEVINDPNHAGNKLQQIADRMTQTGEGQIQEAKAGLGKGGQLAVDAAVGGLQLVGDIAANAVVPGAGLAMMGARSFGGAAQDARQAGATRDQQLLYGAEVAAASMLTEKIANVAGPFKKAFGGGAIDKLASKLTGSKAGKLILSSLSEGGEEVLENALQPILQRLTYDPDAAYDSEWVAETAYSGLVGAILGGLGGSVDLIGGDSETTSQNKTLKKLSMEDFANPQSAVWNNLDSNNVEAQKSAMQKMHEEMVDEGSVVVVSPETEDMVNASYPDLRSIKKSERTPILREKMAELKKGLRNFLSGLKSGAYEFEVNGNVLEAKLYDTGVREVMANVTQPKAKMLYHSDEILRNAKYLYSLPDTDGDPNIYRWNYFYTPVDIGGDIVGVRIAVRDVATPAESQIYNWNIKKDATVGGAGRGENPRISERASLVTPDGAAAPNKNVAQQNAVVKDPYDIIPNLAEMAGTNKPAAPEVVQQQTAKDPYDIIPNLAEMVKKPTTVDTLPTKEKRHVQRTENATLKALGKALEVPVGVQREDLKPMVRAMTEEYLQTGNISQKTVDDLFERAYQEGIVVDTSYYDQHKDIKDLLRTQAVSISPEDAANIPGYGDFRKAAFNTVKITNNGTPVDVAYGQMSEMAPSLFPADITHPADQLVRMVEVSKSIQNVEKTLDNYYGENAANYKAFAKREFVDSVENLKREMNLVQRTLKERAEKQAKELAKPEMLKAAFNGIKQAKRKADRAVAKELITDADKAQIDRLLKGEITLKDVDPRKYNVKGIKNVYEAKLEYEQMSRLIREYKKQHGQMLRDEADADLGNAKNWKDKARGIVYSRETMERNIRDIAPDRETADRIIRKYFAPVHKKQAESTRAKTDYRNRVRQLNLSRKVADGNVVSEAHAVQLLGEAESNIQMLQESTENNAMRDGKTLQEWQTIVTDLWAQNPKLDRQKIANAVDEFRRIYDELFAQMNEVRVRNGYEPVAYRKGYFPHFQPGETGLLADFGKALGVTTDVTNLPTSINGLTHTFRPGITYFGNAKERLGFNTAYDAVEGFDKYIEGAADVIYQTDNIQRLRALAAQMRYRTTDEGIKKQVDEIRADGNLTEDQKDREVESLYKDGQFTLSNFVVELDEYTNLLANKKSRHDRNMEQAMGRKFYNTVKALESRVAANMVALNPTSWLTNFIPITQGAASLDTKALLKGMWDTLVDYKQHDGMTDVSTFLSNRKGSDPLVRTWAQSASATLGKPMEYIDGFTAGTLVRARYNQNIAKGMSAAEALYEADSWTAGVMADRSKGAMPTLFNRSNPLTKMFTQFQLEVNNQYSYLFKDLPDDLKKKGAMALAHGLLKMFVGAWLYNEVYEHFVGRRPAMDPLGVLNEAVGDLAGYELPNLIDMGAMAISGELNKEDFQTEKTRFGDAIRNLAGNVAEQMPFMPALNLVGINVDSGRIPVASAIPDFNNLVDVVGNKDWAPEKRDMELQKELSKPVTYLLSPFGGGQVKKGIQAARAIIKGGSYKVDSQGREIMQYPVYMDPMDPLGNVMKGLGLAVFGKSSSREAQQWVESGFDSLSAKETAAYQGALEAGVSQRDAFELIQSMGKVKKTDEESAATLKRKMLRDANISAEGKSVIFYGTMASDKDMEMMDNAGENDVAGMAACLMNIKDANLLKDGKTSKAKLEAIKNASMSGGAKTEVYLSIWPAKADDLAEVSEAGVSIDTWLEFMAKTAGLSGDDNSTKKEKVLDVINGMNITAEQKDALYLTEYSEKEIKDAPWHADPYDLVGNIMRGTTLKMPTIKMPEIKIPTLKF